MVWVNLLPWRLTALQKRWRIWRLVMAGVLLLLTGGIVQGQGQRALNQQCARTLTLWRSALKDAVTLGAQMEDARQQTRLLQLQLDKRQSRQRQIGLWLNFARTLGRHFTSDAWLYTLRKTPLQLELQGGVRSISALHQLRESLIADPLFSEITLGPVKRVAADEMRFTMQARLADLAVTSDE